jgi:hypothetical protein
MQAYKTETTLTSDGLLTLSGLPFHAGERVEVIVLGYPQPPAQANPYPLRGAPLRYERPTEPVAEADWEALR